MIVLSTSDDVKLLPGEALPFDVEVLKTCCCESHRANSALVKLCHNGIYNIDFTANIFGGTPPITLQLAIGGEKLPETKMISAATDIQNVSTATSVVNCCGDYDRITVINANETEAITVVAGAVLRIQRVL